jgi:hypothetical protein
MAPGDIALLAALAVATSILSAMVGMAGGIVLLGVMLLYMDPLVAIPLHGVTQLLANSSRAWIQRREIDWSIVGWYAAPLLPAAAVGLPLAQAIPAETAKLAIGLFVLVATWLPKLVTFGADPGAPATRGAVARRFVTLGAVTGFLGPNIGATGPLQAPFFLKLGLARRGLIGTFAASQVFFHLSKIAMFGAGGFAFQPHLALLACLCGAAIAGTWIGSRLLGRVSERTFRALFKTVLTLVALRLVI